MEQKNKLGGAYESPEMNVLEMNVEGVLCGSIGDGSGEFTNEGWKNDDDLWS